MYSKAVAFMASRVWKRSPKTRSCLKLLNQLSVGALTLLCQAARLESAKSARMSEYNSRTIYRFKQR